MVLTTISAAMLYAIATSQFPIAEKVIKKGALYENRVAVNIGRESINLQCKKAPSISIDGADFPSYLQCGTPPKGTDNLEPEIIISAAESGYTVKTQAKQKLELNGEHQFDVFDKRGKHTIKASCQFGACVIDGKKVSLTKTGEGEFLLTVQN